MAKLGQWSLLALCSLSTGCGGLRLTLHKAAVQKPSNVALYYSVENSRGQPVPALPADAFHIFEDGQLISPYESKQTILNPEVSVAHYMLLLLDLSGSITESGSLPALQQAAESFTERVGKQVQIGAFGFDGGAKLIPLADFAQPGAAKQGLARLTNFKARDPSTNLNGAIVEAVKELEHQLKHSNKPIRFATLVVFTDGTDRAHRVSEDEMLRAISESKANVFVIGLGGEISVRELEKMATAGFVRAEQLSSIANAFDQVAGSIEAAGRKFYLLSYCSPSRAGAHKLRIDLDAVGESGDLTYQFDADGFGPACDPNQKPNFSVRRVQMPSRR
jgi:hypothetical protein